MAGVKRGADAGRAAAVQAAATLQEVSSARYLAFVALAMFVQVNWGLYGVCSRYLQTQAAVDIPTIQLDVVLTAVAWAGLVAFYTLPTAALGLARAACNAWQARRQPPELVGVVVERSAHAGGAGAPPPGKAAPAGAVPGRRAWLVSMGVATAIGGLVAAQGLTLIWASRYTVAYIVQLVFLLTPLATALANKVVLRQPTPPHLLPTLAAALAASALIIVGNYMEVLAIADANPSSDRSPARMAAGLGLAITSMLLLTAYLVALQVTQHLVTGVQVMWGNTYVTLVAFVPLALAVEGTDWSWVLALRLGDWGVMVFAGFFIDALNTIFTQQAARVLGAAVVSIFISLRLVSSLVGSIVLLGERPTHMPGAALVWAGFAAVCCVMTAYMVAQRCSAAGRELEAQRVQRQASLLFDAEIQEALAPAALDHGLSSLQPGGATAVELQRRLVARALRQRSSAARTRSGEVGGQELPQ
ncbi:hypothetical protein HT031_006452 [Scenedesmus sp. PABB004]|nr:hypothetical protein HT031_006452 [Scenedesmus sp. PABB004]